MTANLAPIFLAVPETERLCRLRELRAVARVLCGPQHPLVLALGDAIRNSEEIPTALAELDRLAPLQRRRLLSVLCAVLPARCP